MSESLDDLINAIQYAVIEAQEVAEDHHANLIGRFFHEVDGKKVAITQEVWVPDTRPGAEPGSYYKVEVPLMALANLGSIKIKELRVEFTAKLSSLDTGEDPEPAPLTARRKRRMAFSFRKGAEAGSSTEAKISITFVGGDPPEGVVRLNDQVLKLLP